MSSSLVSQDVSAVVCFRYVSAKGIFISLNLCREKKNTDDGFVYLSILTKLKRWYTELINEITNALPEIVDISSP